MRDTRLHDADRLWPLIEPKVRAVVRAVAGVVVSGAGVPVHELGGSQHKGTLRNDQAPQFLLLDGTRKLTGNLAVETNVTIDGVDISAHAADPNAHHARSHGILSGDHTVTGSQYQVIGLTAANSLGLLTPSSSPGANTLVRTGASGEVTLNQVEITNLLYVDGVLDMGVDTLYEDATYLNVTGAKPVRFAQKVQGTGWSITDPGVLAAAAGNFVGSVQITNGGDLTVGNNVLVVDVSQGNVGIGGVPVGWPVGVPWPDPQFALDVSGPLRATYIVGKLAIQLPDAAMICHYDGRAPYETNFAGDPNGHMGQIGTASGGIIFRPGKFGKAVQIAEATTNLVVNPSFETNTTGWTHYNNSGTSAYARVSTTSLYGAYCLRATSATTGAFDYMAYAVGGLLPSTQYAVSVWVNVPQFFGAAALNRGLVAFDGDNQAGTTQTATITAATAGWVRLSVAVTTTATAGSHTIQVQIYAPNGTAYFDAVQCEQKAYSTPYCDGSLGGYSASGVPDGSGHAWTGTAHASTSTRAAAALSYPTAGNITTDKWTVMAWVNPACILAGAQEIFRLSGTTAGHIILRLSGGRPQAYAGTGFVTAPAAYALSVSTWTHLAATYDGATVRVYVNGALAVSGASSGFDGMPAAMYVGRWPTAAGWFGGSIDELCFLRYTAGADLLRSIYESGAPIFAETSIFGFQATQRGLVRGDDEGLWIRDTLGNPVLGVYGGEAATKTWAGWSDMAVGDVIIGRNVLGASALRWTQATGKFGFFGNANLTPQVEIGTDGSLTAAGGILQVGLYGLRLRKVGTTDAVLLNGDGLLMGTGGARASARDWSAGSRLHWFAAEIYEADPETYTNGATVFERNPLVVRNVGDSAVGNVGTGMVELAAVTGTRSAKVLLAAGTWLEGYSTSYGAYSVVDVQADLLLLNEAVMRGQRYVFTGVEWMRFDGTVGATNPISTAALGAYAGKLKINVNGTDRWIPYYA